MLIRLLALLLLAFTITKAHELSSEEEEDLVSKTGNLSEKVKSLKNNLKVIKNEVLNKCEHEKLLWQLQAFSSWYQDMETEKCQRDLFYIFHDWTPIQRRFDGSLNFYRNWSEYQQGFGNKGGEFFLGLEEIHKMTFDNVAQELLIILGDHDKEITYAKYDNFSLGSNEESYAIKNLGNYRGTAGDALTNLIGQKFTTKDRDNDNSELYNCAKLWRGAWWFNYCYQSNLNGPYLLEPSTESGEKGIVWDLWHGLNYSLKFTLMLVRTKPQENK